MKCLFNKFLLMAAASLLLWSCKKDETRAILQEGVAPTLSVSATSLVLQQDDADEHAVDLSWDAVNYGFADALQYVLQISKAGTEFASASTVEVGVSKKDLKKSFTVAELNSELNKILPTGVSSEIELRLKTNAGNIFSNVVKMNVTPYKVIILYTYPQALNVAGNFQGWSAADGPQLVSASQESREYVGFVEIKNEPQPAFKLVKGTDWSDGDFGGTADGKLTNGGSDIKITTGTGIYLLEVDTRDDKMTWKASKIEGWGLIGSAIPGTGWDSDHDLVFDATSKTYSITIDLVPGEVKFRANDDWSINLGDRGADGKPELGVDNNIKIAEGGNYTITLDLLTGGNWAYTVKKN